MAMTSSKHSTTPEEANPLILKSYGDPRFHTEGDLLALAYAADGSLCSVEEPGVLRRWDADGRPIDRHFLSDLETLWCFSRDAQWVAAGCDELIIWDVTTQKVLARLDQPSWITAIAFSPDKSLIATGHDDGVTRLWKPGEDEPVAELAEHDMPVSALAFDVTGEQLASAGEDRKIKIWNVKRAVVLRTLAGHTDRIPAIAWHPNGKLLVSVGWDATARVWDVETGEPSILLNTHDDQVQALAFSPKGNVLATSDSASTVHIWSDLLAAQLMHQLPGYAEEVRALAFRPDGEKLAVGGTDRMIHIYDVQTGQLAAGGGLGVRRSLALWNQPRRRLLINAEEGLRMWEVETGTEQTAPLPPNRYLHLATSPDGRWIAGVTPDAIVHLWDHDKRTIRTMDGPRSAPNFLAFSHDSTILFGAVGNEGTVWLWDITKLEPKLLVIEATEGCSVEAVALHPNGQWLLCGGVDFLSTSGTTGNVCLWDLPSKKRILSIPDGATCLIFDATGDRFAFATPDGTVLIAATATGDLLLEIEGRDGEQINDLVFCPEGNALIGAANDSTLRVWDTESGELLGCRQFGVPIHSLVIDRTGRLFAGNENTTCFELAPTRLNELS